MTGLHIVCIGALRESFFKEAYDEYAKRIGAFARLSLTEIPEQRLSQQPSAAEIAKALEREGEAVLSALPRRAYRVALCVEGEELSSEVLAERLTVLTGQGYSDFAFCIGSSFGLSEAVKASCDFRLSFSRMTFPHQLMRVLLAEQLYRALSIQNHSKYHK